jgi:hypothetical protein
MPPSANSPDASADEPTSLFVPNDGLITEASLFLGTPGTLASASPEDRRLTIVKHANHEFRDLVRQHKEQILKEPRCLAESQFVAEYEELLKNPGRFTHPGSTVSKEKALKKLGLT